MIEEVKRYEQNYPRRRKITMITWINAAAAETAPTGRLVAKGSTLRVIAPTKPGPIELEFRPNCQFTRSPQEPGWTPHYTLSTQDPVTGVLYPRVHRIRLSSRQLSRLSLPEYATLADIVARYQALPS